MTPYLLDVSAIDSLLCDYVKELYVWNRGAVGSC